MNRSIYNFYLALWSLGDIPYRQKWEGILDCPVPSKLVCALIYKATVDTFTRYFQLKIIYNFLATRKMLNLWGIRETDRCRFCCIEPESTAHLFWYCHIVSAFWQEVQKSVFKNEFTPGAGSLLCDV